MVCPLFWTMCTILKLGRLFHLKQKILLDFMVWHSVFYVQRVCSLRWSQVEKRECAFPGLLCLNVVPSGSDWHCISNYLYDKEQALTMFMAPWCIFLGLENI